MNIEYFQRLDDRRVPDNTSEIRLFSVVHNESDRLPYFITYYRSMGVDRFFFVDNNSNDGTTEFLVSQPDCHVFFTKDSYAKANYGMFWANDLIDTFGNGHWCLTMDADELLVYPHCETIDLKKLAAFFEKEGSETMFTFLLDMYPKDSLEKAVCVKGKPFLDITPYFDKDYWFVDRISLKPGKKLFPRKEVYGGPRSRCFYKDQGVNSYAKRWVFHAIERGIVQLRKIGIPFPYIRLKSTPLFKVPLVKWKPGNRYTASTHQINTIPMSKISGAILHFKFFADFHARAVKAVAEGEHAEGGLEYKQYLKHMENVGMLVYEGTTLYENSQSLIQTGLIKTSDSYEEFVRQQARQAA